jgi:hypothetical protein
MTNHQQLNNLWNQMRDAIDAAYKQEKADDNSGAAITGALRDYARDISWTDALAALVGRETANERQHRQNRPSPRGFSAGDAANLIVMNCVMRGSERFGMPSGAEFLVFRQTAVEAEVVGFLAKQFITLEWKQAVQKFDYSKLMQAA